MIEQFAFHAPQISCSRHIISLPHRYTLNKRQYRFARHFEAMAALPLLPAYPAGWSPAPSSFWVVLCLWINYPEVSLSHNTCLAFVFTKL